MKKFLIFGLALLLVGAALFADDAKVMPMRVGRFYLAPSFAFANKAFDEDGSRVDIQGDGSAKVFNLGAALEYGILNWMTGALQWAPGINVWSKIETTAFPFPNPDLRLFDVGDLFLGAKMQILGKDGLVKNDNVRLSFAPGIKIPLPGPDFEKQFENAGKGDPVTLATMDKHALAAGLRSYFDFIINDKFFINLYNESLFYVTKKDFEKAGFQEYATISGVNAAAGGLGSVEGKVKYGYDLTFELEPVFSTPIAQSVSFTAGLPVTYKTSPGAKYEFSGSGLAGSSLVTTMETMFPDGDQSHNLTLTPNAALFFYGWPLPMEFKLSYTAPLWGQNIGYAQNVIGFQIRVYFKI